MPFFRYVVTDKTGKNLNGTMNAVDEADLSRRLVSMGYTVVSVINAASASAGPAVSARPAAAQPVARADGIPPSLEPRIPIRLLATYLRQMASMIRSGLTPYQATAEIKARTRNRRLRNALEDMEAQVQAGGHLAPVLTAHPDVFPTKVVGLIYCGELGGYMDRALDEAATDVEKEASARLLPRLVYGFVRLNVVLTILMLPVAQMGAWMTQMMDTNAGNSFQLLVNIYMQGFWRTVLPWLAIYVAASYAWPQVKRVPSVRSWLDAVIVKIPIWGRLHASRALGRFGQSLAQLYAAGIPPGPAWAAASSTCPNHYIAKSLRSAGGRLEAGGAMMDAVNISGVFDDNSRALLQAGERAGDIPGMLQKVADSYNDQAAAQQTKGRWMSTSLCITALIIIGAIPMLLLAKGYAGFILKMLNDTPGGH